MSRRAWGAFAAVPVLWRLPSLFIKIADDGDMPPLDLAWLRIALGAAAPSPPSSGSASSAPPSRSS